MSEVRSLALSGVGDAVRLEAALRFLEHHLDRVALHADDLRQLLERGGELLELRERAEPHADLEGTPMAGHAALGLRLRELMSRMLSDVAVATCVSASSAPGSSRTKATRLVVSMRLATLPTSPKGLASCSSSPYSK